MIYPHGGTFIQARINDIAFEYNVGLVKSDLSLDRDFSPLCLQAAKLSENGEYIVYRLSEQNGCRGRLDLKKKYCIMNMLEDVSGEAQAVDYKPFEILTIAEKL